MSEAGPYFYAWCDEPVRLDAFEAALSALVIPGDLLSLMMSASISCRTRSIDEVLSVVRLHFGGWKSAHVLSGLTLRDSERTICFESGCYPEESECRDPCGPLNLSPCEKTDFLPCQANLALGRIDARCVEAEAEIAWHLIQHDLEDLLLRLCAPDASGRAPTGACTNGWDWIAPVDMCATYNAKAEEIARDLALSWVSLYDKESVSRIAGTPLDVLHARVDAAPHGARVAVKGAGQFSLSRETVLKALTMSPAVLIEALEAAAVPDAEWRAVAPRAREIMEATSQIKEDYDGPQVWQVDLTTRKHVRFLAEHAPFRVRRLPSGGVVLATHPYRTLWPLWADALFVLGLM